MKNMWLMHKWRNALSAFRNSLIDAISNTDLPSYAPNGHRSGGEKDSNE